jgi:hypothetical protein
VFHGVHLVKYGCGFSLHRIQARNPPDGDPVAISVEPMSERRLNLIVVVAILAIVVAGTVAALVWLHDGSELPKGQDSMDSIVVPSD